MIDAVREVDDLARRGGEVADVGRRAALVVDDRDLVPLGSEPEHRADEVVAVGPKSHEERTIQASPPAAASPCSFDRPYADCGFGPSDSTYGSRLRPSKT